MKKWYTSKTLWVNAIAGIAGIVQAVTGSAWLDASTQVGLLAIVNAVLRAVTKTGLE
jgi:hypothetical protein